MVSQTDAEVQPHTPAEPIVEALADLHTEARKAARQLARRHGVTGSQLTVLKILEAEGEPSLSELSARMRTKGPTLTGIVDRMERDGLVRRERGEVDRRVVRLRPTPRGRAIAAAVPATSAEILGRAVGALDEPDRAELSRVLELLVARVRREIERDL